METNARFYSLSFGNIKTYLFAFLFIAGTHPSATALPSYSSWWTDITANLLLYSDCSL